MTRPLLLLVGFVACFGLARLAFGYRIVYEVGYGAFAFLAAIIALTFFWLWFRRSTPLALGMAFGWSGAASVMAWWWLFNLFGRPAVMVENAALFAFLSIYFVGAVMHLEVIGRSFGMSRAMSRLPVLVAVVLSAMVEIAI